MIPNYEDFYSNSRYKFNFHVNLNYAFKICLFLLILLNLLPFLLPKFVNLKPISKYSSQLLFYTDITQFSVIIYQLNENQILTEESFPHLHRANYALKGWCYSKPCTKNEVAFPFNFTHKLALYAYWEKIEPQSFVTISFDSYGGYGEMNPIKVPTSKSFSSFPYSFRCLKHQFSHWSYDKTKYSHYFDPYKKVHIYSKSKISNKKTMVASLNFEPVQFPAVFKSSITLYANWKKLTGKYGYIYFDGNKGIGTMYPIPCEINSKVTEFAVDFKPPSSIFYFGGFQIKYDEISEINQPLQIFSQNSFIFTRSVTFQAIWKKSPCYIVYLHFSYDPANDYRLFYKQGELIEGFKIPIRPNCIIGGYFTTPSFEPKSQIAFPFKLTDNIEIYVKWIKNPFDGKVIFIYKPLKDEYHSISYHIGDYVNPPYHDVSVPNMVISGWYTTSNLKHKTKVAFPFIFEKTINLYAKWKAINN